MCCWLLMKMIADYILQSLFHCLVALYYGNDKITLSAESFLFPSDFRKIRILFLK